MKNAWLAQTKFVPPRLRDDIVLRSRLVDSLRVAVISRPLTLLSVPAGDPTSLADRYIPGMGFDV